MFREEVRSTELWSDIFIGFWSPSHVLGAFSSLIGPAWDILSLLGSFPTALSSFYFLYLFVIEKTLSHVVYSNYGFSVRCYSNGSAVIWYLVFFPCSF